MGAACVVVDVVELNFVVAEVVVVVAVVVAVIMAVLVFVCGEVAFGFVFCGAWCRYDC